MKIGIINPSKVKRVAKQNRKRRKHIPQRTCVGCRTVLSKREMVRIVRTPDGVFIDTTGKQSGRGAYLHQVYNCWERGLKGALAKALKTALTPEDKERLQSFMASLSERVPGKAEIK